MKTNHFLVEIPALDSAWMIAICNYSLLYFRILNKNPACSIEAGCDFKLKRTQINLTDHKMSGRIFIGAKS
ncbi:MAG: hypothetical protein BGO78_12650 [Chloroflexi bacterium 44-23]|nr:MAG: hypothetical protein BGO78_12650 [Chloroflexi bacterium 44-23]